MRLNYNHNKVGKQRGTGMALRQEVEAHWAQVETTFKVLAAEAAYDENGEPAKKSVDEYAGLAVRSTVAMGWLWADWFRLLKDNLDEIKDIVVQQPADAQTPEEIKEAQRQAAIDQIVRTVGDDARSTELTEAINQTIANWENG